ncbi:hypothetical protein ACE38F_18290 [Bacillus mycoides]|uniref:hypothetical protein n=2 Tax=Bacillus TaxID=1386 RepID=UPI0035CAEBEC
MIMNLIGCSAGTASAIISAMDWISYASLLMSLTGVGAAASAAVWSYRATILGLTRMGKRAAANAL